MGRGGRRREIGFTVVRWVLGLLLLTAAGLKLQGQATGALAQNALLLSPRLQFATVLTETLLGLWLISGRSPHLSRWAALSFFGLLSLVSLYLGIQGQSSCGCFGRIEVSPWATFAVDAAAVLALTIFRPRRGSDTGLGPVRWQGAAWTLAGTVLLLLLAAAWLVLQGGSPAAALARLRGETVSVDPAATDLGRGERGEKRTFPVTLTNNTNRVIRVVGGTSDCSCVATDGLPVDLEPGAAHAIDVRVTFRGSAGRFQNRFVLHTGDDKLKTLLIHFAGRVTEPPPK
jgi:hypothetical protein